MLLIVLKSAFDIIMWQTNALGLILTLLSKPMASKRIYNGLTGLLLHMVTNRLTINTESEWLFCCSLCSGRFGRVAKSLDSLSLDLSLMQALVMLSRLLMSFSFCRRLLANQRSAHLNAQG